MPRRKKLAHQQRVSEKVIAELRELIRVGVPWDVDNKFRNDRGVAELRGLVSGHFFFDGLFRAEGDMETKQFVYEQLREQLVPAHVYYRPGLRPWGWWEFGDAPEPRRVIGRDLDEDNEENGQDDGRLPAAEDPDLPDSAKRLWLGAPTAYDGFVYESQYDYLARLDLLFREEKEIFRKYGQIINVYIAQGERGKCAPCWERAREIAKKIDFDLDSAIQRFEFWIPGDLYIDCEHWTYNNDTGIFVDAD